MESTRKFWFGWAESLRKYQLQNIAASFLEGASPFAVLGAQVIYFGGGFIKSDQLTAIASLLEDENEAQAFANYLSHEGVKQ